MSTSKDRPTSDRFIVQGGIVTVETQVGAGRARVDVQPGQPLPDDVPEAERLSLIASGAVVRDGGDVVVPDGQGFTAPDGVAVVRPVPGVVEPDEIDHDVIPGGSIAQVMDWVGDDLARARVALEAELAKGMNARAGLVKRLNELKESVETEPPTVPEALNSDLGVAGGRVDSGSSPAFAGGVEVDPRPFSDTMVDPDAVPAGSAAAVLEWVDGDAGRAQRALDAEQAKGDGSRKGLVADLTKLVEA